MFKYFPKVINGFGIAFNLFFNTNFLLWTIWKAVPGWPVFDRPDLFILKKGLN